MLFLHPAHQSILIQIQDLEWKFRRLVLVRDEQTREVTLDYIWINQSVQELHGRLVELLAKELLAARLKEAELYYHGYFPHHTTAT